jgi:hypothetical protein
VCDDVWDSQAANACCNLWALPCSRGQQVLHWWTRRQAATRLQHPVGALQGAQAIAFSCATAMLMHYATQLAEQSITIITMCVQLAYITCNDLLHIQNL